MEKVWECKRCRTENPMSWEFCKGCRKVPLPKEKESLNAREEAWNCRHCSSQTPKSRRSCNGCGKDRFQRVAKETSYMETWICRHCSSKNPKSCGSCNGCGKNKRQLTETRITSNEEVDRHCSNCDGKIFPPSYTCFRCRTEELKLEYGNPVDMSMQSGIDPREQRIVLIGKTGSGKSATANTILNEQCFMAKSSPKSITKKCQYVRKERFDKQIMMVDTPGLFDTNLKKDMVDQEIKKCITISAPGPHAFLLITSLTNRFTEEEAHVFNDLCNMFGEQMKKYLIVAFTGRDQIDDTVESHIEEYPEELQQILKVAGGGYVTFNNKGSENEKEHDVRNLLCRIQDMLKRNGGGHFTSEMFEEAEKIMQDRIRRELEAREDDMRREIKQELMKEMEERMQAEKEKFQKLHEKDKVRLGKMKMELKKEKERTKRKYNRESEKTWTYLLERETERTEQKNKLLQEIDVADEEEKVRLQNQLAGIEAEIKDLTTARKKLEEVITGERLTTSFIDRSLKLREEERDKTEKEDEETLRRYRQIGLKLYGGQFLNMFSEQ